MLELNPCIETKSGRNTQAVERVGRSALKGDNIPDDLLVLSCEEDYATCVPFLERGWEPYNSCT